MYSSMISGESIRNLRIKMGLTQKELAEKVGITQQSINLIEHEKRKIDIGLYMKISGVLDPNCENLVHLPFNKKDIQLPDVFANDTPDGKILNAFHELNTIGQDKAIEQVELLTKIPEYKKDTE